MSFFIRDSGGKSGGKSGNKRKHPAKHDKEKKFKKNDGMDEEIDSDEAEVDGLDGHDVGYESEEDKETAEEKKLRMAKLYLQEIEQELKERGDEGKEEEGAQDGIQMRLNEDVDAQRGKLRREITSTLDFEQIDHEFLQDKHHKQSITCLVVSNDTSNLYTASKDKGLVKWELPSGNKLFKIKGGDKGQDKDVTGHCHTILCLAVSSDNKFLASGDCKKNIFIWTCHNMERVHVFSGHKDGVSGLAFRRENHTLFSSSYDRSIKVWNIDELSYIETLFGHQGSISDIDAGFQERCVSAGGMDRTVRVWKIVEESQLVFNHSGFSVDIVRLLNEEHWVTAGEDGHLAVWGATRKKPLAIEWACHGRDPINDDPYWISAMTTLFNSDMIATGSRNGTIKVWSVSANFRSLSLVASIKLSGFVNSLSICAEGKMIVAGGGQEHRLGRWWVDKSAKNRIHIFKLNGSAS